MTDPTNGDELAELRSLQAQTIMDEFCDWLGDRVIEYAKSGKGAAVLDSADATVGRISDIYESTIATLSEELERVKEQLAVKNEALNRIVYSVFPKPMTKAFLRAIAKDALTQAPEQEGEGKK